MKGQAWYNETDPFAATWLRRLIAVGAIAPGVVDERSVVDVRADDLRGFSQCHFFAGVGGWSLGLRLAGWPDDAPVWTGSAPCQPLSSAGQRFAHGDRRHLWTAFYRLISECSPAVVFGEQVASALGAEWCAGVRADLEAAGFAVGIANLPAAGVGAPHNRPRLYWLAAPLAHTWGVRWKQGPDEVQSRQSQLAWSGSDGFWSSCGLVRFIDGSARRVESGTFPLAHGFPDRVGLLRGYGNAVVPQVAAAFVRSAVEALKESA